MFVLMIVKVYVYVDTAMKDNVQQRTILTGKIYSQIVVHVFLAIGVVVGRRRQRDHRKE